MASRLGGAGSIPKFGISSHVNWDQFLLWSQPRSWHVCVVENVKIQMKTLHWWWCSFCLNLSSLPSRATEFMEIGELIQAVPEREEKITLIGLLIKTLHLGNLAKQ